MEYMVIILWAVGMSIGIGVFLRGCYIAVKTRCTDINCMVFSLAGAIIVNIVCFITSILLSHVNL